MHLAIAAFSLGEMQKYSGLQVRSYSILLPRTHNIVEQEEIDPHEVPFLKAPGKLIIDLCRSGTGDLGAIHTLINPHPEKLILVESFIPLQGVTSILLGAHHSCDAMMLRLLCYFCIVH